MDICLAKPEVPEPKPSAGMTDSDVLITPRKLIFLDALINALDVPDDRLRPHPERTRTRSASPSPRPSVSRQASDISVKPACLYVSNWTDDEKCRRRNERMRFNEAQLAERFNKKLIELFLYDLSFDLDRILKH